MPMEDWNHPAPMEGIQRPTLDWNQDILEPRKQTWRPVAGDAPVTPQQTLKSVVSPLENPAPPELASCGRGRGQTITEKLREIANMGPAAAFQFTRDPDAWKKKQVSKKPTFPSKEEQEACKWYEE